MAVPSRQSLTDNLRSPASPQQGNLTGSRRVVNDHVVSFYKAIQKWNEFFVGGSQIFRDLQNTTDADFFQKSCEKLGTAVESMKQQWTLMDSYYKKLASLSLHESSNSPVFKSWTHKDFGNYISH